MARENPTARGPHTCAVSSCLRCGVCTDTSTWNPSLSHPFYMPWPSQLTQMPPPLRKASSDPPIFRLNHSITSSHCTVFTIARVTLQGVLATCQALSSFTATHEVSSALISVAEKQQFGGGEVSCSRWHSESKSWESNPGWPRVKSRGPSRCLAVQQTGFESTFPQSLQEPQGQRPPLPHSCVPPCPPPLCSAHKIMMKLMRMTKANM